VDCANPEGIEFVCNNASLFTRPVAFGTIPRAVSPVWASPRYEFVLSPGGDAKTFPGALNIGRDAVEVTCLFLERSGVLSLDHVQTLSIEPGAFEWCGGGIADGSVVLVASRPVVVNSITTNYEGLARDRTRDSNEMYRFDCRDSRGIEFVCCLYDGFVPSHP
jgi:hypothetical protein